MKVIETAIEGVLILEPKVFGDERGFFFESFNQKSFDAAVGKPVTFVQDNHSRSGRGVLRGMHWQHGAHAQGKLVRVVEGSVFDVAVDLRSGSSTFGQWVGVDLDARGHRQLWIPAGLAHGFVVTSAHADFLYKATNYYSPSDERAVLWNDPTIGIEWPDLNGDFVLSEKDARAPTLDALALSR